MRIDKFLILVLSLFLLPNTIAASLPDWVTTPPGDSNQWFYSVGMGENKKQAQQQALEELSARLQVTAQSNTQQFVEAKNGTTELYLETDSLFTGTNLTFTNIDIVNTAQHNDDVIVLVKVDRQAFFQQLHDQLKDQLTAYLINNRAFGIKQLSPALVKLIQYNQAKPTINKTLVLLRSYSFETVQLDQLMIQLTQAAQSISAKVGYQVLIANNDQKHSSTVKLGLINQMQSIGLSSAQQAHTLKVVFAGLNVETTTTDFHSAIKMSADLIYVLDDQIIYQNPIHATSFSQTPELAEQQAIESVQLQLGSNE
ncbi:LPP20 family lipoprotein [Psychrosphaera sp. F3M07]|uniref:LPP20 family lipoprotein n=1 Tax=Psychrosphaera sp. F3M07 TaxID=2841560 RepID=UPI001C08984F|nr:LPP20 family lipoprotein [Psychrosphaera sp. F3M07]